MIMSEDIKKGLLGIVVDETSVSQVMPDINSLTYRGYAVQDLCEKCNFEEVAYLILNKELPNKSQLKKFKKDLEVNRNITINLREIINNLELHCPGIEEILIYENLINPGIQIAINGEPVTTGLATIVPQDAEINIIPAISGG